MYILITACDKDKQVINHMIHVRVKSFATEITSSVVPWVFNSLDGYLDKTDLSVQIHRLSHGFIVFAGWGLGIDTHQQWNW